ncbi:PREDICTED: E3 ubiquitin-protein ligase RNF25 [Cyprinodon variegatus]|uniref:E3 ubiquitin-protein ligase RNF25 n=1 Tax=Cyprinodon variegatus TaxID=28743 RepID=UPI000742B8EF|nr:PREDICTED: E3 ubiquitin-protein ligase RNF25 [Cyprinodon variegatus]
MAAESEVQSEIEVLQSIYLEELQVDRTDDGGWEVSLVLYPSTAEDLVSQFVRLTLTLTLDRQVFPTKTFFLLSVQKCLQAEARSWLGSPVLYQLIEKAKEILTESNIPHGNCVICLYGFKEGETFTKTSCYHYFHSHCLGRYVRHSERELRQREKELQEDKTRETSSCQELTVVCPVCREPLAYDVNQLLSSPAPELPELDQAAIGSDFQRKWAELQKLLEKQRCNGGVIDPEEESNRFLIHIQEVPPVAEIGNPEVDGVVGPPVSSSAYASGVRTEHPVPEPSQFRGLPSQRRQNQARGPRRGGRPKPHPGRSAPITEQLGHLSLSPDCADRSKTIKVLEDCGRPMQRGPESFQPRTGPEPEKQVSPNHLSAAETEGPNDGGGRGHRGRRRGPYRPSSGPPQQHWDSRPRSRGGGPRRGHYNRGLQQKVVERGREEVV